MTNTTALPVAAEPADEDQDQDQDQDQREQHAVNDLLAEAGEAGRRAAGWVRELAARQSQTGHRTVLERAADAIEQASGREIRPGGEGELDEELRYDLGANVVTGSVVADGMPELSTGERIALVAICALAAAMPATVLNDCGASCPPSPPRCTPPWLLARPPSSQMVERPPSCVEGPRSPGGPPRTPAMPALVSTANRFAWSGHSFR